MAQLLVEGEYSKESAQARIREAVDRAQESKDLYERLHNDETTDAAVRTFAGVLATKIYGGSNSCCVYGGAPYGEDDEFGAENRHLLEDSLLDATTHAAKESTKLEKVNNKKYDNGVPNSPWEIQDQDYGRLAEQMAGVSERLDEVLSRVSELETNFPQSGSHGHLPRHGSAVGSFGNSLGTVVSGPVLDSGIVEEVRNLVRGQRADHRCRVEDIRKRGNTAVKNFTTKFALDRDLNPTIAEDGRVMMLDDVVCDPQDRTLQIYPGMWHQLVGELDEDVNSIKDMCMDLGVEIMRAARQGYFPLKEPQAEAFLQQTVKAVIGVKESSGAAEGIAPAPAKPLQQQLEWEPYCWGNNMYVQMDEVVFPHEIVNQAFESRLCEVGFGFSFEVDVGISVINSDVPWRRLIRCVHEQNLAKPKSSLWLI